MTGALFFLILSVGINILFFICAFFDFSMAKERKKFLEEQQKEQEKNQEKFRQFEYYLKQKEFNAFKEFFAEREDNQ